MPRFFNRIRKQLAKENKFFQYSRYAIGEIALVVIGKSYSPKPGVYWKKIVSALHLSLSGVEDTPLL
ncbi:hypothetical protein [Robiginitalea aurantiaca]|uniref:hypothetical protein n=1 Tax=Robiginitalea aurantiaca TaxID=3056915 RepID=UPI0025AA0F34|nr:hypothetical protein [Robiginitalea aurantiaca]